MKGKFSGVGVGPGDPELLTLKGMRVLRQADLLCAPKSKAEGEGLALKVARSVLPRAVPVRELVFPMTRCPSELVHYWQEAAASVHREVSAGKHVVFVTLGDPTLYSTYTYLLRQLLVIDPALPVETIPGVTAVSACTAALNIPLAEGGEGVAIMPGGKDLEAVAQALTSFPNTVIMKAASHLDGLIEVLERLGLQDRSVFASRCGLDGEKFTRDLRGLRGTRQDYFSLLVVKRNG